MKRTNAVWAMALMLLLTAAVASASPQVVDTNAALIANAMVIPIIDLPGSGVNGAIGLSVNGTADSSPANFAINSDVIADFNFNADANSADADNYNYMDARVSGDGAMDAIGGLTANFVAADYDVICPQRNSDNFYAIFATADSTVGVNSSGISIGIGDIDSSSSGNIGATLRAVVMNFNLYSSGTMRDAPPIHGAVLIEATDARADANAEMSVDHFKMPLQYRPTSS